MHLRMITVGKLKEKWLRDGYEEYAKRLGRYCRLELIELPEARLPEHPSGGEIACALESEGKEILKRCEGKVIALCIEGKPCSSEQLAQKIEAFAQQCGTICFIIGSSFGLHESVKQRADFRLSMSPMTFTHQIARVLLSEQIYRAYQILTGGKYHK